jgi:DNA mismatch repair protein MutL
MNKGLPPPSPPKIDLLPEHLIDQIKAGEVIERPGNLIKEILENAVDAGATKLELTLRNNGLDLISLKDNGHGMRFADLPLAFSRHATSKISRFEDLYKLHSFGFRGEALASIAAISKLQCISRTLDGKSASELRIEGGMPIFHGERQTSSSHGTELVIQDLFFNTPARLKFIQSQQSEKTFIRKIIFAFILSSPGIEFQIKIDDADKDIFPGRGSTLDRIKDLFPKAQNSILYSQRFYENNELDLYLIPGSFKAPLKLQNIFINDRYIMDKQLHRVMANGLESTLGGDDFHYIAYFNLPPDSIDVNVHPNKTIIKVMEMSKMISLLTSTIKELGSKRVVKETSEYQIPRSLENPSLFDQVPSELTLQQERHEYNMEGLFSPHNLEKASQEDLLWIENSFIKKNELMWLAVSGPKLLELFTKTKIKTHSPTIPLLVSEPFPAKNTKPEMLKILAEGGAEIEYLGADTLVLRGIPEWMNGFPLKEIMQRLLLDQSFSDLQINPADWSQSTWLEMLEFFPIDELVVHKIVLNMSQLLKDKFK